MNSTTDMGDWITTKLFSKYYKCLQIKLLNFQVLKYSIKVVYRKTFNSKIILGR